MAIFTALRNVCVGGGIGVSPSWRIGRPQEFFTLAIYQFTSERMWIFIGIFGLSIVF